ncbi:hypothetical protein [Salibacterium lacus]|uniref:Uncharacterized protein n=1 Tax=Salibacterium lacus TaxID=1898109 RepID=A0ABW5T4T8_9BACI
MKRSSLKPVEYPDSMTVRIAGIVFLGFLLQVLLDNILPTLHHYYQSHLGGSYEEGLIVRGDALLAYIMWIFPVAFYCFTLPKSKWFQGILFTTVVMLPLVWYDYYDFMGVHNNIETISIFRHAFFSVPFMFTLHVLLPEPDPLPKQETEPQNRRYSAIEDSKW